LERGACCFLHFPGLDEHAKGRGEGDEEGRVGVEEVEEDDALGGGREGEREGGREEGLGE
jgi:hypothetical protein